MFDLTINNFRSFIKQSLSFSRINILIGENSGGKSSLLKFLLALKQTFDTPDELNLKLTGDYVDLGNYEEVIYQRKAQNALTFGFEFNQDYFEFFTNFMVDNQDIDDDDYEEDAKLMEEEKKRIIKHLSRFLNSSTKASFKLTSKLNTHFSIKTLITNDRIGRLEILQVKQSELFLQTYRKCKLKFKIDTTKGIIEDTIDEVYVTKDAFLSLVHGELLDICKKRYKKNGEEVFYRLAFLLVSQNCIKSHLHRIKYVNPIKTVPQRFYFQEDKRSSYKLVNIERVINAIGDKTLTVKESELWIKLINKYVKNFGLADQIRIIRHDTIPVMGLEVKTKDLWSNITDVGYGVSLQIPILFQAIMSETFVREGETILIEQPEVHLHPNLQAKFIENLLSIGRKNTYFIETHSEHIVRKLQSLVKNKELHLKPEDISIHYFRRDEKKFTVSYHGIDQDGVLTPVFPDGFYDVSYKLVKELF